MQTDIENLIAQSDSWDGYVRERAVRALGQLGDGRAVPPLLIRVNDWVPEVRVAARAALENYLDPEHAAAWVASLPEVYHLKHCGRDDHGAFIARVEALLVQPACWQTLLAGLDSTEVRVSRHAFHLVERHDLKPRSQLLDYALQTHDVVIKRYAEEFVRTAPEIDRVLFERLLTSWHRPLRRLALQRFVEAFPDEAESVIEKNLVDRSGVMREVAQRLYRDRGGQPAAFYVGLLEGKQDAAPLLRKVLLGISVVGAEINLPAVQPYLDAKSPAVRTAAYTALVRLDGKNRRANLLAGLERSMGDGCADALRWARRYKIRLGFDELAHLLDFYDNDMRARRAQGLLDRIAARTGIAANEGLSKLMYASVPARVDFDRLIQLARLGNKWDQLYFLVAPLKNLPAPRISLLWEIRRWLEFFNRSQVPVTAEQQERLREPILAARRVVDDGLMDTIAWHVFGAEGPRATASPGTTKSAEGRTTRLESGSWMAWIRAAIRRLLS